MRRLSLLIFALCTAAAAEETNPNPALFPKDARPYGRSIERWAERLWIWEYAQPFDHSPLFDRTGADCAVGQEGPVWFLDAVPGGSLGSKVTRRCTIPAHRALLLALSSALNDYPCPDPTFKPAPGETLFDFLLDAIAPLIDKSGSFEVTLDGTQIKNVLSYRYTSDDVFYFKGDLSLKAAYDSCVTGQLQAGVADGHFLMFKPLTPGNHTIVVNGHDMTGMAVTLIEELTIR